MTISQKAAIQRHLTEKARNKPERILLSSGVTTLSGDKPIRHPLTNKKTIPIELNDIDWQEIIDRTRLFNETKTKNQLTTLLKEIAFFWAYYEEQYPKQSHSLLRSVRYILTKHKDISAPEINDWIDILSWLPEAKRRLPVRKKPPATLHSFIEKYCDLSENPDIKSKCELLMREDRKGEIKPKLPKMQQKYSRGRRYTYDVEKLIKMWPKLRITYTTLPPLKNSADK